MSQLIAPSRGRTATIVIAASNSSAFSKACADYVCTGTNDDVVINAAISALNALGGGVAHFAAGTYNTTATITLFNNIVLRGQGRKTIIAGTGTGYPLISGFGSSGSPMLSVEVWDMSLDCTGIVDSSYTPNSKGLFTQYTKRAKYMNLFVLNAPATGIGTDFMIQSVIHGCVVDTAGRQFAALGGTVGSNGIGIGTGVFAYESVAISDCHTVN